MNDKPAFPRPMSNDANARDSTSPCNFSESQDGMSLRQYFAAAAIPTAYQMVKSNRSLQSEERIPKYIAEIAFKIADEMVGLAEGVK